ncbi:hypothetical protein B296_00017973 [Ensete ventricosum]|uniref:Uncharacterized protein n=1 Tax=Ensete ventricosum TaxID=4639 RepID=A0A427ATX2_ENSVE|nr:hypothetical protein B296_00017973 [Ensete ventricosum]
MGLSVVCTPECPAMDHKYDFHMLPPWWTDADGEVEDHLLCSLRFGEWRNGENEKRQVRLSESELCIGAPLTPREEVRMVVTIFLSRVECNCTGKSCCDSLLALFLSRVLQEGAETIKLCLLVETGKSKSKSNSNREIPRSRDLQQVSYRSLDQK